MGGLVKYTDMEGNPVQGPVKKRWKYPITLVAMVIISIPSVLVLLAILVGGASLAGQLLLVALVAVIWLCVVGVCLAFEADAKGYW